MIEMLQYGFMQRALITAIVIAAACSLLGVFLVLRRYALIGDGIAHIAFGGVAAGMLFGIAPFIGALIFSLLGSIGILKIKDRAKVYGDSAIGIVSHAGLGIGVFILSAARGFNVDILGYLFGSILAIRLSEVYMSIALAAIVIAIIIAFYNDMFAVTFDEISAKTLGIRIGFLNTMLILLTALTIVSSMRVVGLLLASSLIILPASSALQLGTGFRNTLIASMAIGIMSVVGGMFIAYAFDFAVSGTIVLLNVIIFLSILLIMRIRA
jgi:zinc transport system permease protein